jgi:cytochrome P450
MSATSFGGSFDLVRTNDAHLKNIFVKILKTNAIMSTFGVLRRLPFMPAGKDAEMDNMIENIVSKRREGDNQNRRDLLQIFIDAHKADPTSFSKNHLIEEMRLFMCVTLPNNPGTYLLTTTRIAGADTTGTSATYTVALLVNHPEKLSALKKEIDTAFPSKDSPITFAKAQDLPYLNAVINESMRLMPIAAAGRLRSNSIRPY